MADNGLAPPNMPWLWQPNSPVGQPNALGPPMLNYAAPPNPAAPTVGQGVAQTAVDVAQAWPSVEEQRRMLQPLPGWQGTAVDAAKQWAEGVMMGTTAPGEAVSLGLPVRPASEDVGRAMDATFVYGKDLGPATVPIDSLSGGVSNTKTEASRVADLKDQMSGPGGYISRPIVDTDGNVIEGQHRVEALRQLGATTVPVHVIHDLASNVDTDGLNAAVRNAQTMHSDQRTQIISHVLDALHEEGGSAANVQANYDAPRGYEPAWDAALDFLGRPSTTAPGDVPPPGIVAYHGSPHSFDQFDTSKIGTGEGAQAYGHGLYMAGNEAVAQSYKGAGPAANAQLDAINTQLSQLSKQMDQYSTGQYGKYNDPKGYELKAQYDALMDQRANLGHMYQVNIGADPEHFLDWDKPLSEQHPVVQQAFKSLGYEGGLDAAGNPMSGGDIVHSFGDPASTAQLFQQAGLPGIRYLDQGSRGAGQGTHNYVVFDAATIDILRKYGIAGLIAGGGAAAAGTHQQQPSQ